MQATIDQPIANLALPLINGDTVYLDNFKGKNIVLYFYPKDDTPGCTQQAKDFAEVAAQLAQIDTVILGVSRDDAKSHLRFKEKYCLPFELICDNEEILCNYFGVIKLKNMYGKKVRGIERSTFLIDKQGMLKREWRNVKVTDHVKQIVDYVKTLV